jgi:hypothetical protein
MVYSPCRYFFKIFDVEHKRKLSGLAISKWCHTVFDHCQTLNNAISSAEHHPDNIRNEVFDFVKPSNNMFITWADLCKSEPVGDDEKTLDVCGVLCDASCMLNHCGLSI